MMKLQLQLLTLHQSSTNLRQAKLLATPHCRWGLDTPDLTSFIVPLLKFPVFFPVVSGTVFVWILWMATRHWCLTTRGIPTPGIFKEDPLRIAGKCKFTIAIIHMGVSKNSGTPKWMVYNGNPIKMDDLGNPLFSETSI